MNEDTFRKLNYIKDTKEEIKTTLNSRGAHVEASTPLSQYPEIIKTFTPISPNAIIDYNNIPNKGTYDTAANITRNIIRLPKDELIDPLREFTFSSNIAWESGPDYTNVPVPPVIRWNRLRVLDFEFPTKGVSVENYTFKDLVSLEEINSSTPIRCKGVGLFDGCNALRKLPLLHIFSSSSDSSKYITTDITKIFNNCSNLNGDVNLLFRVSNINEQPSIAKRPIVLNLTESFVNTGRINPIFNWSTTEVPTCESINLTRTFAGSGIQNIILPSALKGTLDGTFNYCSNLNQIQFQGNGEYNISKSNPFTGCINLNHISFDKIKINLSLLQFHLSDVPLSYESMNGFANALLDGVGEIRFMYKPEASTISTLNTKGWTVTYENG